MSDFVWASQRRAASATVSEVWDRSQTHPKNICHRLHGGAPIRQLALALARRDTAHLGSSLFSQQAWLLAFLAALPVVDLTSDNGVMRLRLPFFSNLIAVRDS
jgi:hypothetical protein